MKDLLRGATTLVATLFAVGALSAFYRFLVGVMSEEKTVSLIANYVLLASVGVGIVSFIVLFVATRSSIVVAVSFLHALITYEIVWFSCSSLLIDFRAAQALDRYNQVDPSSYVILFLFTQSFIIAGTIWLASYGRQDGLSSPMSEARV